MFQVAVRFRIHVVWGLLPWNEKEIREVMGKLSRGAVRDESLCALRLAENARVAQL